MREEPQQTHLPEANKWIVRWQRLQAWLRLGVRRGWPFAAGALAALVGLLLYNALYPDPVPLTADQAHDIAIEALASATPPPPNSALVYQRIIPSIVYIQTSGQNPEDEEGYGVGSGVVINENGDILTAYHVVEDATLIEIFFADGTEATAAITAAEPDNDIAVLHPTQPPGLIVPAVMGNPNAMRVGDEAFAVGNPMGLAASLSAGVISGFDRSIPVGDEGQRLEGLIQFDTAVNPGNSGGPLLNRNGQVVGIVTALANPSQQNFFVGIGFAVPIDTAVAAAGAPPY
jgi:S1-C subfamily serine protease